MMWLRWAAAAGGRLLYSTTCPAAELRGKIDTATTTPEILYVERNGIYRVSWPPLVVLLLLLLRSQLICAEINKLTTLLSSQYLATLQNALPINKRSRPHITAGCGCYHGV